MSRSIRCLSTSFRSLTSTSTGSTLTPSRTIAGARRYVHAVLKTRPEPQQKAAPQRISRGGVAESVYADEEDFDSRGMSALDAGRSKTGSEANNDTDGKMSAETSPQLAEHLNGLFSPLQFPTDLAQRILTHGSHPAAAHGHNAGLRFMGRRVLESYLLLFLTSSPALKPTHDMDAIISRTLNTYVLGEHIGSKWGLGRALRWTPTVPAHKLKPNEDQQALLRNVGLYKVQGDAVAAVMGGIFYQFGASVAHRVFHTRILPNILLGRMMDGLPESFHADAHAACERMGGVDGDLFLTSKGEKESVAATI